MKNYFKRLRHHPGLGVATLMSIAAFGAALTNKNIHSTQVALIVGGVASALIWSIVLLSNFRK